MIFLNVVFFTPIYKRTTRVMKKVPHLKIPEKEENIKV